MTNAVVIEPSLKKEFLMVCDTSLANARRSFPGIDSKNLDSAESLAPIAQACYKAFSEAAEAYRNNDELPLVYETDPYNHESPSTRLVAALMNVPGFTTSQTLKTINPDSIAVLEALKPIVREMYARGYCIFT